MEQYTTPDRDADRTDWRCLHSGIWSHAAHQTIFVLTYSKTCGSPTVNIAGHDLFSNGSRLLDKILPTQRIFSSISRVNLPLCNPCLWSYSSWSMGMKTGWAQQHWLPFWTTLADASKACALLLHYGCTKACTVNWKCSRAELRCTALCKCGCLNNEDKGLNERRRSRLSDHTSWVNKKIA